LLDNDFNVVSCDLSFRLKQEVGQQVVDAPNNKQANHFVTEPAAVSNRHQQFLGDASAAIPNFGHIDLGSESLPDGVTTECLAAYENLYLQNCEVCLVWMISLTEFLKVLNDCLVCLKFRLSKRG